jgi:hypothetical protein
MLVQIQNFSRLRDLPGPEKTEVNARLEDTSHCRSSLKFELRQLDNDSGA